MVEPQLPDDAWIEVFKYLSVEDRVKHVQFTSKRFYKLCSDSRLSNSLDLRKAIFMADSLCLNMLLKARAWIRRLNLKGCHWFSSALFSKFPDLPSLVSLNLMRCLISPLQLLDVLKMCPNVKNLAVSLSSDDVKLLWRVKNKSPNDWPLTTLTNLQVEMDDIIDEPRRSEIWMRNLFFSDDNSHGEDLDHENLGSSSENILKLHSIPLHHSDERIDDSCLVGFPETEGTDLSLPCDVSKVEYLEMPCKYPRSVFLHDMGQPGNINFTVGDVDRKKGVLGDVFKYWLESDDHNRACLRFYSNLFVMTNLKELNLTRFKLHEDLLLFVDALRQLRNLTSLAISLIPGGCTLRGVERNFFSMLATCPFKLRKLQVDWSQSYSIDVFKALQPIGNLITLEVLNLSVQRDAGDVAFLCDALKRLVRLVSFSFHGSYDDLDEPLGDCSVVIHEALKYLPNLTELIFKQRSLDVVGLEHALVECKNLEILCVCSLSRHEDEVEDAASPNVAVNMVKNLVKSLPRLHVLALRSVCFDGDVYNEIQKYSETLHKEGRRISICCGYLLEPCDECRSAICLLMTDPLIECPMVMEPSALQPFFSCNFVRARCME